MSAVRLAIVGAGRLTELGYLPACAATPDVRLVGVVDPAEDRARLIADVVATTGAPRPTTAPDLGSLLASESVDAVVVASPVPTHVPVARVAAEAGLLSLVEKPPAADAVGARELASLDPAPIVGFNRRFDPGAQRARVAAAVVDSDHDVPGRADAIIGIEVTLAYRRASWQAVSVADDVLADLGPHAIDWVRWVARRRVAEITAASLAHDRARVEGRLEGGCPFTVNLAADRLHRERLRVVGTDGVTIADHRLGGPVGAVTGRVRRGPHLLAQTLTAQLGAFTRAVRGQRSPLLGTAADGVAVMATIDAARTAASSGMTTPVTLP